jgi:SOS response regulatory protein OraA/RecX
MDAENPDKLIAALMRYGYTRTEIRTALKEIME